MMSDIALRLQSWNTKQLADQEETRRLAILNAKPARSPEELIKPTQCKVTGGVDQIYSWTCAGRSVQLGDIIMLPFVDAVAFEKIGRVKIV